ncbi:hypothetical protein C8R43DRAFT_904179 [Mycena crocata]|nr:hypothetical protein C8R43DRAFT_904179 [Mycena crocata]
MPPISNTPLVFDNSKFIWTPEMVSGIAPPGERSFRKIFATPAGKAPVFAQIISICDEAHTFYVNGREVGSVPSFYNAQSICVGLEPCVNVFGIQGRNGGPGWPAAATATIRITYLDGTTTILATDSSWKSYGGVAPGFSALSFDDSSWSPAYTVGATSWTTSMGGKAPPVAGCQALSFDDAYWIRTSLPTARPVGWRTFRRTLTSPAGKSAVLADIIISADAEFALYMNGALFGHTFPRIGQTKHFCVGLLAGTNVFAAKADYSRQTDHIGILSTMQITYTDNSTSTIVTDSSWLASTDASAGFERPDFDDRGWKNSDIVFKYPVVFGAFYNHTPEKVECQNVTLSPCPGYVSLYF